MATLNFTVGGVSQNVPVLDVDGRVETENIPAHINSNTSATWKIRFSANWHFGDWRKNDRKYPMQIVIRHKATASTTRYTQISTRSNSSSQWFHFYTPTNLPAGSQAQVYATIPPDWEYSITTNGGTSKDTIDTWYEFY
jgi:hypothetical protein